MKKYNTIRNKDNNKSFFINNFNYVIDRAAEEFSINGYKLLNLHGRRKLISIFDSQFKSGLKKIIIKKAFFKNNKSLLLELMDLSVKHRSIVLVTAFQSVYDISLANREVIIQ